MSIASFFQVTDAEVPGRSVDSSPARKQGWHHVQWAKQPLAYTMTSHTGLVFVLPAALLTQLLGPGTHMRHQEF